MEGNSFERRPVVINTWLPEDVISKAVKECEEEMLNLAIDLLKKEGLNGSEDGSADRVETDSRSEEE